MEKDSQLEGDFYQYLHRVGEADPEWNRDVLRCYVPYFSHCERVLDVGCGQGDFIQLLESAGVEALGVDADSRMVEICRKKGLQVSEADLFDYLPQNKEQFDGVFSSNLIEHLSAREATQFVQLVYEALEPGGLFLVTTPNPASLIVHLREFWRDATHVRLYDRSLLEFMLQWAGFVEIRSHENSETSWEPSSAWQRVPERIEELALLRRKMVWTGPPDKTTRHTRVRDLDDESGSPRQTRSSDRAGDLDPRELDVWARRRARIAAGPRDRSMWRRLLFSLRRRVARFLADTVLFEEFAAFGDGLAGVSSDLNRTSTKLMGELVRVNRALSRLMDASVAVEHVERRLYENQNALLVTPREVFVVGRKPQVEPEVAE